MITTATLTVRRVLRKVGRTDNVRDLRQGAVGRRLVERVEAEEGDTALGELAIALCFLELVEPGKWVVVKVVSVYRSPGGGSTSARLARGLFSGQFRGQRRMLTLVNLPSDICVLKVLGDRLPFERVAAVRGPIRGVLAARALIVVDGGS